MSIVKWGLKLAWKMAGSKALTLGVIGLLAGGGAVFGWWNHRQLRAAEAELAVAQDSLAVAHARSDSLAAVVDTARAAAEAAREVSRAIVIPEPVAREVIRAVDTVIAILPDSIREQLEDVIAVERTAHAAESDSLRRVVTVYRDELAAVWLFAGKLEDQVDGLTIERDRALAVADAERRIATTLRRQATMTTFEKAAWAGGGLVVGGVIGWTIGKGAGR